MSLVKSPIVTPEKLAANQANGQQSHGPVTPEGLDRARAARLRHGYYSKAPGAEMHALGEDPEQFERLFDSLVADWGPENEYQTSLVRRMARLMWRLERGDRIQEAVMVRQMENLRHNLAREQRDEEATYEQVVKCLKNLMATIDSRTYCSTEVEMNNVEALYGKEPRGVGFEISRRVFCLLPADRRNPAASVKVAEEDRIMIAAHPADRDQLRAELRVLLREEIKRFDQEHIRRREETEEEMTPAFRDSMLIPKHPQASLLVRLGDSDLRQLRFVTDLLVKLQGRGRKAGRLKSESAKNSDSPTM